MEKLLPLIQNKLQKISFVFLLVAIASFTTYGQDLTSGGKIAADQNICVGEIPELLTNDISPSGGNPNLSIEYLWVSTNAFNNNPTSWSPAPGDNSNIDYQPGAISSTTFYARCSRRSGYSEFVAESNIVTITLLPSLSAIINGSCEGYAGVVLDFSADFAGFGASYVWRLNGQIFGNSQTVIYPFYHAGTYDLTLTVTGANGCSITSHKEVVIVNPVVSNEVDEACDCSDPFNFASARDYYLHDIIYIKSNPGEDWTYFDFLNTALDRNLNPLGGSNIPETAPGSGVYTLNIYFNPESGGWQGLVSNGMISPMNTGPGVIFNPLECVCPDSPLPVELASFEGIKRALDIQLKWVTVSETDNSHFELERSKDGIRFEMIGKITGAGSTNETTVYNFVDEKPLDGVNYYQFKQVDFDGSFEYSDVVSVKMDWSEVELNVSPNPVQEKTKLILGEEIPNAILEIITPSGQIVKEINIENTVENIDMSELPNGIYFFRVKSDSSLQRSLYKVVKY